MGSLAIGATFSMSLVSGILTDHFGLRRTTLFGGILAASGMLLSSFLTDNVAALYLTYGLMYGLGAALTYTPSLAILGHYFKRYLGLVNGVVTAGSSAFTIAMPAFLNWLVEVAGLPSTLRVLALMSSFIILCALLFKPLQPRQRPLFKKERTRCTTLINVDNWRRKRYVIWALTIPFALFGYFVPYVHFGKFVADAFPGRRGDLPVMCIGVTSGLGRLIFGYVADLPRVDRILLQQISFASIGLLTVCLPFAPSYEVLLAIALAMGLFDGCFISLLGPIAFDLCGAKGATQGIGFLLSLCSLPLTLGAPIAGLLYDHMQSYTLPFILAGLPPLGGAVIMNLMRCVRDDSAKQDESADAAAQPLSGNCLKNYSNIYCIHNINVG